MDLLKDLAKASGNELAGVVSDGIVAGDVDGYRGGRRGDGTVVCRVGEGALGRRTYVRGRCKRHGGGVGVGRSGRAGVVGDGAQGAVGGDAGGECELAGLDVGAGESDGDGRVLVGGGDDAVGGRRAIDVDGDRGGR